MQGNPRKEESLGARGCSWCTWAVKRRCSFRGSPRAHNGILKPRKQGDHPKCWESHSLPGLWVQGMLWRPVIYRHKCSYIWSLTAFACVIFSSLEQSVMASGGLFRDQPVFHCEAWGCAIANTTAYYFWKSIVGTHPQSFWSLWKRRRKWDFPFS